MCTNIHSIHRNFIPYKEVSENIVMELCATEAAIYSVKQFSSCSSSTEINIMSQPPSQVAVALWWFSSAEVSGMRSNKLDLEHECQLHAHPLADGVGTITRTVLDDNVEQPRDCFTRFFYKIRREMSGVHTYWLSSVNQRRNILLLFLSNLDYMYR